MRINRHKGDIKECRDAVAHSLRHYGFALLSGIGSCGTRSGAVAELAELSSSLGNIVRQSPIGEMVEDVRDFSDVDAKKDERGYRSRGELSPHSDPSTLIVLHCLQGAKFGGESHIVNVRAIHDRMKKADPMLLSELFQHFPNWRVEGQYGIQEAGPASDRRPVFCMQDKAVSCVLYRPFIEMSANALGEPLTKAQVAALDLFEESANDPELTLRFMLEPGQTMLLHNRTVLHARTDYIDWPEPEKRRHLLRVWINAPELLPVSPQHELGDLFAAR